MRVFLGYVLVVVVIVVLLFPLIWSLFFFSLQMVGWDHEETIDAEMTGCL